MMLEEQKPPVSSQSRSPPYNDAFLETLVQRLTPPIARQLATMRTKLVGMSLGLAIVSLVALGCLTYLFLSMGIAGSHVASIQVGTGLSSVQQLLGISITSLAVVLVNVVFNVVVFREIR